MTVAGSDFDFSENCVQRASQLETPLRASALSANLPFGHLGRRGVSCTHTALKFLKEIQVEEEFSQRSGQNPWVRVVGRRFGLK